MASVKARYVFPVEGPPLRDGVVAFRDGRIVSVERGGSCHATDLGNVALLPGLINAHTHLEFSQLERPLGRPGQPFAGWIGDVIAWRASQAGEEAEVQEQKRRAICAGLSESRACGVAAVGEIATPPVVREPWHTAGSGMAGVVFLELLGLARERAPELVERAEEHVGGPCHGWRPGISPHAPYTIGPELLERVMRLSAESRFPVAMHLAESIEELQLLESHSGPLVELLERLGAWHPDAIPRGLRPLDYLEQLAGSHRALVVHGNYLSGEEIRFAGEHRDVLSIVYCPRTHAYFSHAAYPLARMLAAGVNVALGTDSRASNPDLSVWRELCWVARHHADVAPASVLKMGTLWGARALGWGEQLGSLRAGKRSDFALVPLPAGEGDPHELLFNSPHAPRPPALHRPRVGGSND